MKKVLLALCMLAIACLQYGSVLFYDNFDRTEGSSVGNGWTNIGPVNPLIENGAMKLSSSSLQGVRRDFTSLGITSGIYFLSWDWKISNNDWLADAFPNGTITYLRHDYEGNLYYDNTSDFSNAVDIGDLPMNTWVNVKMKVNIDTDRFSIWLNDVLTVDNALGLAVVDFTRFTFRAGSGSSVTQYIDDFIVYNDISPATPTNLIATGAVNDITLNWTGAYQDFLTYRIYRSTTSPAATLLAEVPGTQTSYVDNTAQPNTDYYYRVKAVSMGAVESGFSNEVMAHRMADISVNPMQLSVALNVANNQATSNFTITNTGSYTLNYALQGTDNFNPNLSAIPGFTALGTHNGHSYYRSNSIMSWTASRALCEQYGGHLATIADAAENSFLTQYTTSTTSWIGFTDEVTEGTFRWVTNEPVTYTNWNSGEPNNSLGVEDFTHLLYSPLGRWNDSPNSSSFYALLEIDYIQSSILSCTPYSGSLVNLANQNIVLNANGTSLADGLYQSSVLIVSNAVEPHDTLYIPVTVKVDYTPPLAPLGLVFDEQQSDMNQIYLDWTANALADSVYSYKIYRRGLHESNWVLKGIVDADQTWFIDNQFTGLDTTAVYYRITAVDWVDNEGAASEEVLAWLQRFRAPTGLTLQIVNNRHVRLEWNPVTQTISGNPGVPSCYVVYRSNTPMPLEDFYYVAAVTDTSFVHNWAAWFIEEDKQFYVVTAYGGNFEDIRSLTAGREHIRYGELEALIREEKRKELLSH